MDTYLEVTTALVALCAYVFGLFYLWYRFLVSLASRCDIPERRRRAARWYPVVMLLFVIPVLAALFCCLKAIPASRHLVAGVLACSILPGLIWWICKMPSLSALGYGRQR
jgi:hypothetical protein